MIYSRLGNSALQVSNVSFGCMSLGADPAKNERLLNAAAEHGINLFDTADLYQKGANEVMLGKALKGVRDKVVIATKVGNQWRNDGSGWDWNPSKAYILQAVDKSLERLQTDYIDLYQLHGGTIDDPIDETIEAFEILQQQGKIRYYGISSIRPNVIREWVSRSNMVSVMIQYSLLDRRPEESCLDLLHKHNIGVLARGSLAQGLLLGKPATPYLSLSKEEVEQVASTVRLVAGINRSAAEVAGRFVLHHPAVTSAVLGIRISRHLQEARDISLANPLSSEEIDTLINASRSIKYEQHR